MLVCCAFSAASYHYIGVVGLLTSAPLWGILLCRVVIDFFAEMRGVTRHALLHADQGQFYSFQGMRVEVIEDDDYCQWVAADQVRKILGQGATDRMLALTYPQGWALLGRPPKGYLRDDALLLYLAKESALRGVKFRVWVERHIVHQARKRRAQFGIRLEDPREASGHDTRPTPVVSTLPQA